MSCHLVVSGDTLLWNNRGLQRRKARPGAVLRPCWEPGRLTRGHPHRSHPSVPTGQRGGGGDHACTHTASVHASEAHRDLSEPACLTQRTSQSQANGRVFPEQLTASCPGSSHGTHPGKQISPESNSTSRGEVQEQNPLRVAEDAWKAKNYQQANIILNKKKPWAVVFISTLARALKAVTPAPATDRGAGLEAERTQRGRRPRGHLPTPGGRVLPP